MSPRGEKSGGVEAPHTMVTIGHDQRPFGWPDLSNPLCQLTKRDEHTARKRRDGVLPGLSDVEEINGLLRLLHRSKLVHIDLLRHVHVHVFDTSLKEIGKHRAP